MSHRLVSREQSVGAFEAKTKLSRYLADAQRGIVTVITLRGRPAAKLVPAQAEIVEGSGVQSILDRARALRARCRRGKESLHELINTGRR